MKKLLAILSLTLTSSAFASGFMSLDVDKVNGLGGSKDSLAQYVRAGKSFGDVQMGLQSRTAQIRDGGGLVNSVEVTRDRKSVV